ncbi:MAG TPA: T9SS type A sorting domain-containing protein [Bacteroidales bacterium]|nr:T9SS type A sorting domain-containing protein [Bacteroidales bacterium]
MKHNVILFFVFISLTGTILNARLLEAYVISSGGYYTSAAGSFCVTLAETTMVQTLSSMGNFLTQGFQQPDEWYSSIQEEPVQGNFVVYPDPNYGNIIVTVQSKENGEAQLSIYDVLGQKEFSIQKTIVTAANLEYIDIRGYSMGIYFLLC